MTRRTATGGLAEGSFQAAVVETARVVNVNIEDWSVDVVSEFGNKQWFDIQVMSPYLHYMNGEGIYVMPEIGALCWVCTPSAGMMATPFILGFQMPIDERTANDASEGGPALNFRGGRQLMNPGDIMMKTRDENFLILRRGGVVQIGATPTSQRLFIPIRNIIRDVCENYQLFTLAGEMDWKVDRADQSDAGDVLCSFSLRSKTKANEPNHAVVLRTGSHEDDASLRLSLVVNESGATGAPTVIVMKMDKAGSVSWDVEKNFSILAKENVTITSEEKNLHFEALIGSATLKSKLDLLLESSFGNGAFVAKKKMLVKGPTGVDVEGALIALKGKTQVGGAGGEAMVKGQALVDLLGKLIQGMFDASQPHGPAGMPPGFPVLMPVVAKLLLQLPNILSTNNTTT